MNGKWRRLVTGVMVVVMVVCSVMTTDVNRILADTVDSNLSGIVYEFANNEAGFAQGTITIHTEESGKY